MGAVTPLWVGQLLDLADHPDVEHAHVDAADEPVQAEATPPDDGSSPPQSDEGAALGLSQDVLSHQGVGDLATEHPELVSVGELDLAVYLWSSLAVTRLR